MKIKVLIRVTRTTEYATIREMLKDEYDELRNRLDSDDYHVRRKAEDQANALINVDDWQDDNLDDLLEFEPFVETAAREKLSPEGEWK